MGDDTDANKEAAVTVDGAEKESPTVVADKDGDQVNDCDEKKND